MSADLPVARKLERGFAGAADAHVTLDYAGRFLRRRRLLGSDGQPFLVDLPQTVSVEEGDAFLCDDGRTIGVEAASEDLFEISGPAITRYAWHIGNRHQPCEILPDRLRIQNDPVIGRMLEGLGASVVTISAPFTPEGGAYGHGRTHGHSHE
ncbi:urease accessory protein [Palleronia aestuarii]|uniref:Urease accessory protein UreE n=1 Tax=Palleronia aestuarii TaxID=568105 RepID=A0A2W7N7D4_9RHOB|nr:urease accessory protein UreE [Palleronia aestuarii]PZX16285.1 urease accessory protein [Palleronia aestuarii]